jgi:hypothetical protein
VLIAIAFSIDFWKVCIICLLKFYPECIITVICVISAEGALPCCCPKCLFKVLNISCAEVPGCVRGRWLVLFLIVRSVNVITNVTDEDACLSFCAWAVGKYVTNE